MKSVHAIRNQLTSVRVIGKDNVRQLDKSTENQAKPDDRAAAQPTDVVELAHECRQAEPGNTDNRWIGEFGGVRSIGTGHKKVAMGGKV
jgi:hypothetical protein